MTRRVQLRRYLLWFLGTCVLIVAIELIPFWSCFMLEPVSESLGFPAALLLTEHNRGIEPFARVLASTVPVVFILAGAAMLMAVQYSATRTLLSLCFRRVCSSRMTCRAVLDVLLPWTVASLVLVQVAVVLINSPFFFGVNRAGFYRMPPIRILVVLICVALFVIMTGVQAKRLVRRGKRLVGRCLQCGYDLRGQAEPRCPECGAGRHQRAATSVR